LLIYALKDETQFVCLFIANNLTQLVILYLYALMYDIWRPVTMRNSPSPGKVYPPRSRAVSWTTNYREWSNADSREEVGMKRAVAIAR